MSEDRDKASDELKAMLGFPGLGSPAANRAGIDRKQLSDVRLPNSRQTALQLLQLPAAVGVGSANELVKGVADHVAHPLDADQGRLESVEIARRGVHRRVHVDESRVQGGPLLVAQVGGLELRLQVGQPPAHVGEALLCRAIDLRMAGHLIECLLERGLDALDLGVDLFQTKALRVFGSSWGQVVSLLSTW